MGYCKDCKNAEYTRQGLYCSWYKQYCKDYDSCERYYEPISSGSSNCFLTTACVETMHKSDDCYELTVLRNFRDTYIKNLPYGIYDIEEYYQTAPQIVNKLSLCKNNEEIFKKIYSDLILRCIGFIENNENDTAYQLYKSYVNQLKHDYLETDNLI